MEQKNFLVLHWAHGPGVLAPQEAILSKETIPIIGVTRQEQVEDAAKAGRLQLSGEDMEKLETAAVRTAVDTRGAWEHPMA